MNYPLEKYKFITYGNKVIALSTYAGKKVRAVASCDPRDTFSLESGKKLAAARCAVKVAEKRWKRANKKLREADIQCLEADLHYESMKEYYYNAEDAYYDAQDEVASLLAEL